MRTFIAIDLDPEIKKAISDFLRRLKKLGSSNIGWIKEQGMHLTLKFLGEIDDAQVSQVKELMEDTTRSSKTFLLKLKGTGFFPPNSKYARVLWIGTVSEAALLELQERLESRLEGLGFSRENRPFHPHLTLGRVKNPSGLGDIISEFEKAKEAEFGEMTVKRITLFKSTLKPTGAEYTVLHESPLS